MKKIVLAVVLTLAMVLPAAASTVSYSNLAAWSAAAGPSTFVNLTPFTSGGGATDLSGGFTASGVTFKDPNNNYLYVMTPAYGGSPALFPGASVLGCNTCGGAGIDMYLPGGTYSLSLLGMDWYGGTVTITLDDGSTSSWSTGSPNFFGITSTVALVKVEVDGGSYPMIGEIQYGQTAVPEPATLLLLGVGLSGLASLRYRKH